MECIGPDETALAADAPGIMKKARVEGLAHRGPAQYYALHGKQPPPARNFCVKFAPEARAIEKDRLLRKPFRPGPGFNAHADINLRCAVVRQGPVNLLGRLSRDRDTRSGPHIDVDADPIPSREAATRREEHCLGELIGFRLGKQNTARRTLIKVRENGMPVRAGLEFDPRGPATPFICQRRGIQGSPIRGMISR
jgi:hypothetical protein